MPKIEVQRAALMRSIGAELSDTQLEALLSVAKAELDEPADAAGVIKIELNDTNRPDLWSSAGLARQLRAYRGSSLPSYPFFSRDGAIRDSGNRTIVVDPSVRRVRPYIFGFVASGPALTPERLDDLIQTQEKLAWNYGRKRRAISIGIYRADLVRFPAQYAAVDPDATRFVPLQDERELSLRDILREHPKGREFGAIVASFDRFPLLTDATGGVLSFPPIINSAHLGAVQVGDRRVFFDITGTDVPSLLLTTAILACDAADGGYAIEPVTTVYPYDTPLGREVVAPYYFQDAIEADLATVRRMLGEAIEPDAVVTALARMGVAAAATDRSVRVTVPEYRNDFLHPVDVVEDVMIGRGMDSFEPEMPRDFTVGRLTEIEARSRRVTATMVGLGYQEMIFNYLGSGHDFVDRMYPPQLHDRMRAETVRIANPISENYQFVRTSIWPSLLQSESVSANAPYPHALFALGKVVVRERSSPSGTETRTSLAFLTAHAAAGLNEIVSHLAALMFYHGSEYELVDVDDKRCLPGRVAAVHLTDRTPCGIVGELHPQVLEAWGITVPCAAAELHLEALFGLAALR